MLGFLTFAGLKFAARKVAEALGSSRAIQVLDAVEAIERDVRAGATLIHDESTGEVLTAADVEARYAAWARQQDETAAQAAARIDARHAADGTGTP